MLTLYAYVLMPNHFHLLVEVGRVPLSKAMQVLLYRYTRRYNQRYRKSGHLFQGRYKAILCDRDNYLMELIRYLHLNPVRAGMARDPGRYRWSSHEAYIGGKSTSGIAVEDGLKLWGAHRVPAIKAYQQFIRDGLGAGHQEEYSEVKDQRYLGDDNFVEAVCRSIDEQEPASPVKITMEEILRELARGTAVKPSEVCLGRDEDGWRVDCERRRPMSGEKWAGVGLTKAAKYLGRDSSTMSLAVKRFEERDCNGQWSADRDGAAMRPASAGTKPQLSNKQSLTLLPCYPLLPVIDKKTKRRCPD